MVVGLKGYQFDTIQLSLVSFQIFQLDVIRLEWDQLGLPSQPMTDSPEEVCAQLKTRMLSLQLATLGLQDPMVDQLSNGGAQPGFCESAIEPHVSYTPFVEHEGTFLIFVSQLSLHTRDLLRNPHAGIMLIDDEQGTSQIFARTRLTYQCLAHRVDDASGERERLLDIYEARHGKMVKLLRGLPDFVLFRLQPVSGMFVMGFGRAYKLIGPALDTFDHARTG